ncbi:MAG: NFACT RNA binding domain-containing protein [Deltaproteobacteria bacterium]
MSLRESEIRQLVAELAPLAGSRVDGVRGHAERVLTLDLRGPGGEITLLLSGEPDLARIHVATRRPAPLADPLPFQAPWRRELLGARLTALEVTTGDRVVMLRFDRAAGPISLVVEMAGREGNLLLVDDAGRIRALTGRNLSPQRDLRPGQPWVPPESREGEGGPARFPPATGTAFPISATVEAAYRTLEEERALAAARRRLREPLRAAVARSRRALTRLADEAARVPAAEADRRAADLLKPVLHEVPRGAREVTVTEWTEDGPRPVAIAIDPALTPRANMERFYRRYRRIAESAARVEARTVEVRALLTALEALRAELDDAPLAALARLEREARRLGGGPRPQPVPGRKGRRDREPALPYRSFRSLAGLPILVGRGAAENDQLTVRVAKGNDLWLHARGRTGAHVVLRLPKGGAPDTESLLDAAHLAAHFSDARGEAAPEVVYTRARHVRKVKGAAPGAVTYSQEKGMALRVEPSRVERLLQEEEGGGT